MEYPPRRLLATTTWYSGGRPRRTAGLLVTLMGVALITGVAVSSHAARSGQRASGAVAAAARRLHVTPATPASATPAPSIPLPALASTPASLLPAASRPRLQPAPSGVAAATIGRRRARPPRPAAASPATAAPAVAPAGSTVSRSSPVSSVAAAPPAVVTASTRPASVAAGASASPCAAAIAAVESRGLFPAAGFVVECPGYALGHEGMTCMNVAGVCPGGREIVIHDPQPYVVANEFENSRIFSGSPVRCDVIDCGGSAYGF